MKRIFLTGLLLLLVTGCEPYDYAEDDTYHHIKKEDVLCKKINTEEFNLRGGTVRTREEYKCVFIKISIKDSSQQDINQKLKLEKLMYNDETSN